MTCRAQHDSDALPHRSQSDRYAARKTPFDRVGNVVLNLLPEYEPNLMIPAAVDRIVSQADPILSGGIQVESSAGCVVSPGCCCGIEGRSDWWELLETGERVWAGHDPAPWVERRGDVVRIWSDGGGTSPVDACCIELSVEEYRHGLEAVERRLEGFGTRLAAWSPQSGPRLAAWFTNAFRLRRMN